MILGFQMQFVMPIIDGDKIHTIRQDKGDRWKKPGCIIEMVTGHRTKEQSVFVRKIFSGTERIHIYMRGDGTVGITVNGDGLMFIEVLTLIQNDGLTPEEFKEWFLKDADEFEGVIIHWTDLRYRTPGRIQEHQELIKMAIKVRKKMQRIANRNNVTMIFSSGDAEVEFKPKSR